MDPRPEGGSDGARVEESSRLEELLDDARAGQDAALVELLQRLRPVMYHVAQLQSRPGLEAEDLVSVVTLRLLDALSRGGGPISHPGAYVTTAIRNLAIDHARSRASGAHSLESAGIDEALPVHEDDTTSYDLAVEFQLVRDAFDRLPPRQQELLREVVVGDRKPRELASQDGVRANTVSVQLARAKSALAQNVRSVLLERNATPECSAFRPAIARRGAAVSGAARIHLEACDRCRSAIDAYYAIPDVLAVLPLLALGGTAAVRAVHGGSSVAHGGSSAAQGTSSAGHAVDAPTHPGVPGRASASVISTAAASTVSGSGAARPSSSLSSGSAAATSGRGALVSTTAAMSLGWIAAVAGAVAGVIAIVIAIVPQSPATTGAPPSADSAVVLHNPVSLAAVIVEEQGSTRIEFDIHFDELVESPVLLDVEVPASMRISDPPPGWGCPTTPGGGSCTIQVGPGVASLTVTTVDGSPAFGPFHASLSVSAGALQTVGNVDGIIVVR